MAVGVLVAVGALAGGAPASGVAATSIAPVPLVPGTEGASVIDAVSDTDPPRLLVTTLGDPGLTPPTAGGVYVVDASTRAVTPVFAPASGFPVGAAISANAQHALYGYSPTDEFDATFQVFRRSLATAQTTQVSSSSGGAPANAAAFGAAVSDDGRYVVFESEASNLAPGEGGPGDQPDSDVFLRDTVSGTTLAVSNVTDSGSIGCFVLGGSAGVSADASTVAYTCATPTGESATSFVYDRASATSTRLISPPDRSYELVAVSGDGSVMALVSGQVPFAPTSDSEILLRTTATGAVTAVPFDIPAGSGTSRLDLSADGRFVMFDVITPVDQVIYVHDRVTGATSPVTGPLQGDAVNGLLGAGNRVYFFSSSEVPGQPENPWDAFVAGFRPFAQPPAASPRSGFVPVPPDRVAAGVTLGAGGSAYLDLSAKLPPGATAAAVNVTLSGVTARTYVSVCSAGTPRAQCLATSTVNPYPGRDVANLSFPQLASDRVLQVYNNEGAVIVNVDLVGYFTGTDSAAADFQPVTPTRDDQVSAFAGRGSRVVTLDAVPTGASAAAIRVTASGVSDNTYISVCPVSQAAAACEQTSTLNPRQQDTSNLTIVPISGGSDNAVRLYNNLGNATLVVDVVGWLVPAGTGSQYVAVAPVRVQQADPLAAGGSFTRAYPGALPASATGVAATVTTAGNTAVSYVSVCPGGTPLGACTTTSAVNPNPGQDTASSTLARLGTGRDLLYYNNRGNTLLFTDVQGYFVPRP